MFDEARLQELAGQYVSFILHGEEYGVRILSVHEIIRYVELTRVPQSPPFIDGVLNLRGQVIPVINLRKKFDLPAKENDASTRIMVVEIGGRVIGMVVDKVKEVQMIDAGQICEAPEMGTTVNTEYIVGMAKVDDSLKILLDISKVFSEMEKAMVDEAVPA